MEAIKKWLRSNSASSRLTRTVFQAVVGVLIANIDFLIGRFSFSPEMKSFIVALCMAILSPVMAYLGGKEDISYGE